MGTERLNVTHCGPLCLGFSLLPAVFTSASGLCRPQLAIFSLLTDVFTSASSLCPPRAVDVEHHVYFLTCFLHVGTSARVIRGYFSLCLEWIPQPVVCVLSGYLSLCPQRVPRPVSSACTWVSDLSSAGTSASVLSGYLGSGLCSQRVLGSIVCILSGYLGLCPQRVPGSVFCSLSGYLGQWSSCVLSVYLGQWSVPSRSTLVSDLGQWSVSSRST